MTSGTSSMVACQWTRCNETPVIRIMSRVARQPGAMTGSVTCVLFAMPRERAVMQTPLVME